MSDAALTIAETDRLKATVEPVKAAALAMVIDSTQGLEEARDGIKEIKRRREVINGHCDVRIKQAHALHKDLVADKKKLTDVLDEAERIVKQKMGNYQLECERLAREAAEKAQKEAQAEQQRKIEAARKKIDATLSKAGTVQEKVAALEYSLQHDNLSDIEITLVQRQLEVLNLQLQGLQDKAEAAQQKAEEAAEIIIPVAAVAAPEKVAGVSGKKTYNILGIDSGKLILAIAAGKGAPGLVKAWDETMLKKLALMGIFLDGVQYQEDRTISVR